MATKKVRVVVQTRMSYFLVTRVTNSTRWTPGQQLSKKELDDITKSPNVELVVTI